MQQDLNCLFNPSCHVNGGQMCHKHTCHGALESGLGSSISSMDMHWNNGNNCSSVASNDSEPASVLINTCHIKYDCHDLAPVSEEEDCDCMMGLWNKVEESNTYLDQLPWRSVENELGRDSVNMTVDQNQLPNDFMSFSQENNIHFSEMSLYEDLYTANSHNNMDTCINVYNCTLEEVEHEDHLDVSLVEVSHHCDHLCVLSINKMDHTTHNTCTHDLNDDSFTFFNPEGDHLLCSSHYYPPASITDDSIAHLQYPWTSDSLPYPVLSPMCHDIHNSIRKSDICHNDIACINNNNNVFYRRQSFQNSSCNLRSLHVCESRANIFDGDNNEEQVQLTAAERVVEWLKLMTAS